MQDEQQKQPSTFTSRKEKRSSGWFNPKLSEFVEDSGRGKTLIGFYWSMLWRFYLLMVTIYFLFVVLVLVVTKVLD